MSQTDLKRSEQRRTNGRSDGSVSTKTASRARVESMIEPNLMSIQMRHDGLADHLA